MTLLPPEILDAVAHGAHHDPHSVLGVHETGDGWVIRSRRPLAREVVADLADGKSVPLEHLRGGIWEARVDAYPGAYTVRFVTTAGSCQSAPSTTVNVTATAQPLAGSSLHLFPNPTADGKLTLQLSGYSKAVTLTVIDALGRMVLTKQVAAGQQEAKLDLSGAASGVYTLRAVTEGGTDIRRIVRE